MSYFLKLLVTGGCLVLAACAGSAKVTSGQTGATITEAQAQDYNGPKARIAVGRIIDKSGSEGKRSLAAQLLRLQKRSKEYESLNAEAVMGGIRDLLTTALFNSNRYVVLERENIQDILTEQEFADSQAVGDSTRIPLGKIEGAELLVIGAVTGFDPGVAGGSGFPIPIPLNDRGDVAVLHLSFKRAYVSLDLRVIDVKTSRIVASVAVEGKATKFGAGVSGYTRSNRGNAIRLPILLSGFSNTPVEKAMHEMVDAAVANIVEKTPGVYYRAAPSAP